METKICSVCKKELPIAEFCRSKATKDGLETRCRSCLKEKNKKYYYEHQQERRDAIKKWHEAHKEHDCQKGKIYREQHRAELNEKKRIYRQNNSKKIKMYADSHKDEIKQWREQHKEQIREYQKNYRQKNKEKLQESQKIRYKTDIQYKLKSDYLHITDRVIKNKKMTPRQEKVLGCNYSQFIEHLEKQFDERMNWENYGLNGWHIDHIVPVTAFDLTDEEQVKKCFHYTNTQPLWAKDNAKKSDLLNNGFSAREVKAGQFFV